MATQENDSTDIEVVLKDLKKINKGSLTELKSFTNPPQLVKMVMEAVCILLGRTPSWEQSKKLLGDVNNFMQQIQNYDKDNISPEVITKIRNEYTSDPEFSVEKAKNVSGAVWKLCSWVIAMEKYDNLKKSADGK
ncbi:dynein axonemal heavy chain 6-like isoform X2 [Mytilus edulis]|uniref:dynein axonemal heavy chain 6-like isoform X1 n=1 Tax=Mytilus edulis TaxID=6550 RepID=UPI0039EE1F94